MNKTKILPELLKDGILELSLKLLSDDAIRETYIFKDNDNFFTLKNRAVLKILSESSFEFNEALSSYIAEKSLQQSVLKFAEILVNENLFSKSQGIVKQFSDNNSLKEKQDNDIAIKLNLDYLLYKSEFENTVLSSSPLLKDFKKNQDSSELKKVIIELENIEKKIVQAFANLNNYLKVAVKIDQLRTAINLSIFRIKVKIAQNSKEKGTQLPIIYNEFKAYFQKKLVSLQTIIQKISELIANQQTKVMLNTNKYKMMDLSKSVQLFLKTIVEIYKVYEKLEELYNNKSKDLKIISDLQEQLKSKINSLDESVKAIKIKAPQGVKTDIRELFSLYENLSYHKDRMIQFKAMSSKNIDNLNSFIANISREEKRLKSLIIYNSDFADYITIRSYLDSTLKSGNADILLKVSPSLPCPIYNLPDKSIFYGLLKISVFKTDDKLRVDFTGHKEISNNKPEKKTKITNSYFFEDSDDTVKFILNSIYHHDLFNFLESERI